MSKILLVIDMQNDLINSADAEKAISVAEGIVNHCLNDEETKVIYTRTAYSNLGHYMVGTCAWCIADEINHPECLAIDKPAFGFGGDWGAAFGGEAPENISIVGLYTDTNVITNALILRTLFPNTDITVYSNGCAGTTPEKHAAALEVMQSCQIEILDWVC